MKNKLRLNEIGFSHAALLLFGQIWFGSYLYIKSLSYEILLDFIEEKYVQFITCIFLLKSMYLLKKI